MALELIVTIHTVTAVLSDIGGIQSRRETRVIALRGSFISLGAGLDIRAFFGVGVLRIRGSSHGRRLTRTGVLNGVRTDAWANVLLYANRTPDKI